MLIETVADTARRLLTVGDFVISPVLGGWEWVHKQWLINGIVGTCPTLFEAIEAAHAAQERMASDKLDAEATAQEASNAS